MKTTSTPTPRVVTAVSRFSTLLRTGATAVLLLTLPAVLPVRALYAQTFPWATRVSSSITPLKVAADAAGNSYVLGEFSGTVSLGDRTVTSTGGRDVFLAKYNSAGAVLWSRQMGGVSTDEAGGVAVAGDYVYITGAFRGQTYFAAEGFWRPTLASQGDADLFVARFAAGTGALVWATQGGGLMRDKGHGIAADAAGNAYVTGEFYYGSSPVSFCNAPFCTTTSTPLRAVYPNNKQMFVAKYNASGTLQWVTDGYSWGSYYPIYGKAIAVDPAGNLFVAGDFTYETIFDNYDVVDANGNLSFAYPHVAWLKDGSETHQTNFSSVFIARYNPDNSIAWARQVGGVNREEATGIATIGNHVYLSGNSVSSTLIFKDGESSPTRATILNRGGYDGFLAQYTKEGTLVWARQVGGAGNDYVNGLAAGNLPGVISGASYPTPYLTGSFQGVCYFGDRPKSVADPAGSDRDSYVATFTREGATGLVEPIAGSGSTNGWSISTDSQGTAYLSGTLFGPAHFGSIVQDGAGCYLAKFIPPPQQFTFTPSGREGFADELTESVIRVFPVPAAGPVTIAIQLPAVTEGSLGVYSTQGQLLHSLHQGVLPAGAVHRFSLPALLPAGTYLIQWRPTQGKTLTRKLVIAR